MPPESSLVRLEPRAFVRFLAEHQIRRFYFVFESGRVIASHPVLEPIAAFLQSDTRDFARHEGLFFQVAETHKSLMGGFVHRTCRGQAAGGVRYWHYATMEDFFRDGLRLSQGMTRKNALAGLWWGGGKGVILHDPETDKREPVSRRRLFEEYGEFMTSLAGCYVTAEDVGADTRDMAAVFSRTRFTTCIPPALGGSGNPSVPTARGTVCAMEAALEYLKRGSLTGKTVAVQGLGHVGAPLVRFVLEKGARKVVACDLSAERVTAIQKEFPSDRLDAAVAEPGDLSILGTPCDILSPCATGAVLNERTIPGIQAGIVCGAANNQLEDADRDDQLLLKRGITYVPDFLANRMGIVTCANEQYGTLSPDPAIEQHLSRDWEHSVHRTTLRVLETAARSAVPPGRVALRLADEWSEQFHPIFGHRGQAIVRSLVAQQWHLQKGS
jgi:glutamate dehydrogenase/leucine dehydrogenase